jgi:hypothetical protein
MPTCPNCGLLNPPDAIVCNCGYRFIPTSIAEGYPPVEQRSTVRLPSRSGIPWLYQLCLVLILVWTVLCLAGACYGMVNIASQPVPTDPYAKAGHDVGTAIGLGLWAVVWVIPTIGLGVIGLLAKPRE